MCLRVCLCISDCFGLWMFQRNELICVLFFGMVNWGQNSGNEQFFQNVLCVGFVQVRFFCSVELPGTKKTFVGNGRKKRFWPFAHVKRGPARKNQLVELQTQLNFVLLCKCPQEGVTQHFKTVCSESYYWTSEIMMIIRNDSDFRPLLSSPRKTWASKKYRNVDVFGTAATKKPRQNASTLIYDCF